MGCPFCGLLALDLYSLMGVVGLEITSSEVRQLVGCDVCTFVICGLIFLWGIDLWHLKANTVGFG